MRGLRDIVRTGFAGSLLCTATAVAIADGPSEASSTGTFHEDHSMDFIQEGQQESPLVEPCTLLVVGTGVISLSVLVLRKRSRIVPEALLEADYAAVLPAPSVVSKT